MKTYPAVASTAYGHPSAPPGRGSWASCGLAYVPSSGLRFPLCYNVKRCLDRFTLIDTHCHLTFPELAGRLEEVLAAAAAAGVDKIITISTSHSDWTGAAQIAQTHPNVLLAAGIHPHNSGERNPDDMERLAAVAAHPRCVAIGEMGLDNHYPTPLPQVQREAFQAQLELARNLHPARPVIVHCRKALDETLAILRACGLAGDRFVFHCFTEGPEEARRILEFGAMISFTGVATYKNAPEVRAAAKLVPADRIMIETDAPYLTPEPHRKIRINEPKFLPATAAALALERQTECGEFVRVCDANARRFFGLGDLTPA